MPLFSRLKNKGAKPTSNSKPQPEYTSRPPVAPEKPRWVSSWNSKTVALEEVEELIHACTAEMKSRAEALNTPFLLLPFRPDSGTGGARSFIRNFYKYNSEGSSQYRGAGLRQELRLTDPIVLCSIIKWCWSRIPNGVVTWPVYEGFRIGEQESTMARNAFDTFIPIGAGSDARKNIIFDFFDLLCAVAAHGKSNGLGGRKLSRLAGWWAFEHSDDGKGFEGGYASWITAADASSHLFFAYLRSLSPEAPSLSVIERIPRTLQALLASTEYPPEMPTLMQRSTPRVVMLVETVSPTPFALLRRAKHFEYRDKDRVLREFQGFEDPIDALTNECKRVLYAISSINSSSSAPLSSHGEVGKIGPESWSAFQTLGFSDLDERTHVQNAPNGTNTRSTGQGLRVQPRSRNADFGRPTTPSWADFMSSGFAEDEDATTPAALKLPSGKMLPPLNSRAHTPSRGNGEDENLAPGELAAITNGDLDDAFWWVWMTSLAGEEPSERKAVFGRCALIETTIQKGRWLIMEEQLKGASPEPTQDAYIAPKKSSIFSFTKRGMNKRTKSDRLPSPEVPAPMERTTSATPSKSSLAPEQHSRIKAAAAVLARQQSNLGADATARRGRQDDASSVKTSSMFTLGMMNDASPAMQWANAYDKQAVRAQYLGTTINGKGVSQEDLFDNRPSISTNGDKTGNITPVAPALTPEVAMFPSDNPLNRELPAPPREQDVLTPVKPSPVQASQGLSAQRSRSPQRTPPRGPIVNVMSADEDSTEAPIEQDVWPASTPADSADTYPRKMAVDPPLSPSVKVGRKPVPRNDNMHDHPAFRQRSVEDPSPSSPQAASAYSNEPQSPNVSSPTRDPAHIAALRAMEATAPSSSPDAMHQQAKQGGGIKKFFGRKNHNPRRDSLEILGSGNSQSLSPPVEIGLGRRLSLMRTKKPSSKQTPSTSLVALAEPTAPTASGHVHEPVMPDSHRQFEQSATDVSHVDTQSNANAEEEFSRFDQGPVEDMPAATPQDSTNGDEDSVGAASQPHWNTNFASRIAPERHVADVEREDFATPAERGDPTNDAESETTMDEQPQKVDPVSDRWAQIRANAAQRAARASEEHSTKSRPSHAQSTRETDDGETSGEETIESRVARIKARVAELTNNIDGPMAASVRR